MIDYCASFEAQEGLYLGNWLASSSFGLASTELGTIARKNKRSEESSFWLVLASRTGFVLES
jgi:hypothetical protein